MHALADIIIISGWPDDIREVLYPLCPYWKHSESLAVEDGLVFHGEALIIPPSAGEKILGALNQSHQGINKHSSFPVVMSSGLVSTRPLRKLFGNVKHA